MTGHYRFPPKQVVLLVATVMETLRSASRVLSFSVSATQAVSEAVEGLGHRCDRIARRRASFFACRRQDKS
jgi:hypothetical protein